MRIKLDENLPVSLVPTLAAMGHDAHSVEAEGLAGEADSEIWRTAQRESRFLITQDLDFSDLRQFAPGTHCGILLIRVRNPSRALLINRTMSLFRDEAVNQWERCFVVATERKVRVINPPRR